LKNLTIQKKILNLKLGRISTRWAKEQGFEIDQNITIPTDYDNIHLEQDQPSLIIISPLPGQNLDNNDLKTDITASAKRGIKKVE
jgi:hypothetical protein